MQRPNRWTVRLGCLAGLAALTTFIAAIVSCGTAPTPFLIQGPSQFGNEPPTLTITNPRANLTRGKGDPFLIEWNDSDRDSAARLGFGLENTVTKALIVLVEGLEENDSTGSDRVLIDTSLIPIGTYNLQGRIADEDTVVDVYAIITGTASDRVVITIVEEGSGPQTVPPVLTVTAPSFNLSVAQDDEIEVRVQPSTLAPAANIPFDPDSGVVLYLVLDLDLNPNNDDPANPDSSQIIVLATLPLAAGVFAEQVFTQRIDLARIPARASGEPYYIRITADDGTNPRVHQYAVGTINVVQLAAGTVDLADVGKTLSGARFYGFNPGANLGSSVTSLGDFDEDGIDDFVVVAQFGNPQNVGPVGEAYLVYGRQDLRFGGAISVNSISRTVSGVVFQAPPIRRFFANDAFPHTDGITDVKAIRDLTGDGRPELILGLPHVFGAFDGTDYDPGDDDAADFDPFGCYPDLLVNNFTDEGIDTGFFSGGMAVIVNSQNRDNEGPVTRCLGDTNSRQLCNSGADCPNSSCGTPRLESTAVDLELSGQPRFILDQGGLFGAGNIFARADNASTPGDDLGNDPQEPGRIAGARFIGGGFEFLPPFSIGEPREDQFGQNVASLGDLNSDGLDEIILSAPRNERYLADLRTNTPAGFFNPMLESTLFTGSMVVLPGTNYNQEVWRDVNDDAGASVIPFLDQHVHAPFGSCTSTPPEARHYDIPVDTFEVFAENIDDMLGDGQSAGDFNQDGLDDILCGAPRNDRTRSLLNSGATYIIYGRSVFGQIELAKADDSQLRPPMLRIRGALTGDQFGWRQTAGLDVNGDRIDDVFIGSPKADFGGVVRSTCASDFNRDGTIDSNDLREVSFHDCFLNFGTEVFSGDSCKAFDYDNDGDIDDDDRCIFCCLSGDCEPDSTCVHGRSASCCEDVVDNGFVGIIFGGQLTDGDRDILQIGTNDLAGVVFYGGKAGDQAGMDISSAGDFNQDGFGDILISAPGEIRRDSAARERVGVVYLVFGGTHLQNPSATCNSGQFCWNLSDRERGVGSPELPGVVFLSPYVKGRPNEAAPTTVGFIGDINRDGYGDILIGNPKADFIDLSFPQGPDAPGTDPAAGRRSNAGDAYIVYGNNFGSNRSTP